MLKGKDGEQAKKAYICSPYRGDLKRNVAYARDLTRRAIFDRYVPITPHLYLTQCLNDNLTSERELGLEVGLDLLEVCDVIIVGCAFGVSEGMYHELEKANQLRKEIIRYDVRKQCGTPFET